MSEEQASLLAFERLDGLLASSDIVSLNYDYSNPGVISVVVADGMLVDPTQDLLPKSLQITTPDGQTFSFDLRVTVGPRIKPATAGPDVQPARSLAVIPTQGGDPCYVDGQGGWGTAGVYVRMFEIEARTRAGTRYVCAGSNAFLTNNHVIADLDALPVGTPLVTGSPQGWPVDARATLAGFFPVGDILLHMDFALGANVTPANAFNGGLLRDLGRINPVFRNPADGGEPIRKSGARTRVTAGRTEGRVYIRAPGRGGAIRGYNGIYKTSRGFSCPGDSGSIVVANNMDIVGMIAWGEDIPCADNPHGYFFTFGAQAPLMPEDGVRISLDIGDPAT